MKRFIIVWLILIASASPMPCDTHALGISAKLGAGYIPNGSIAGGMVALELGPISPFAEVFRKSGATASNVGANLMLKLPLPMVQPYGGVGGGMSRVSGGVVPSRSYRMIDLVAGTNATLPGMVGLFGQVKYIYTFGTGALVVRDVVLQAGLLIRLGR